MLIQGRGISRGIGEGPLLIGPDPISFLSGVDPNTGIVTEPGHPLAGRDITGSVLVFEHGKGSTVGSYILYALSRSGHAPAAIVNKEAETIIAVGAIMGKIPMIDRIEIPLTSLPEGKSAVVDGTNGTIEIQET